MFDDSETPSWRWTCTTACSVVVPHLPRALRRRRGSIEAQRAAARRPHRARRPDRGYVLWYYTPMALRVHRPPDGRPPSSTTAWTSCRRSRARRRAAAAASAELLRARRPRVHRRPVALRGQAGTGIATSTRSRAASTSRTSRAARHDAADPPDQRGHAAPAARLLRRHRRAARHRAARRASPTARPDWQHRDDRAGRQDRSGDAAARCRTSTTSGRRPTTSCRATSPAGTSRCCRSRATRRRASSARPRRRSTSPPASRWSRRRSATWSRPYGEHGLVRIADTVPDVRAGVRRRRCAETAQRRAGRADAFLRGMSWDGTWQPHRRAAGRRVDATAAVTTPPRPRAVTVARGA